MKLQRWVLVCTRTYVHTHSSLQFHHLCPGMYVCVCVMYTRVCVFVHACVCVHMYQRVCLCMNVCVQVLLCVIYCSWMHSCMYVFLLQFHTKKTSVCMSVINKIPRCTRVLHFVEKQGLALNIFTGFQDESNIDLWHPMGFRSRSFWCIYCRKILKRLWLISYACL